MATRLSNNWRRFEDLENFLSSFKPRLAKVIYSSRGIISLAYHVEKKAVGVIYIIDGYIYSLRIFLTYIPHVYSLLLLRHQRPMKLSKPRIVGGLAPLRLVFPQVLP